jgi:hypothetical protein
VDQLPFAGTVSVTLCPLGTERITTVRVFVAATMGCGGGVVIAA